MDTLLIKIDKDLKKEFQIKTIQEDTTMTDVIVCFIKKYLGE